MTDEHLHNLSDEQVLGEARRRFGAAGFNPAEILRQYAERRELAAARVTYEAARRRAIATHRAELDHAIRQLTDERDRRNDDERRQLEPAATAYSAALVVAQRRFQERMAREGDNPTPAARQAAETRYHYDLDRARDLYEAAADPVRHGHETAMAEVYAAYDIAVQRANARYEADLRRARAAFEHAQQLAARDPHQRGDHSRCPRPLRAECGGE